MIASSSRWLALTGALLFPAAAFADATTPPNAPPSEEQVEAARALYRDARELHRQGKLKEALERALEAYRTASTPVTALQAGQMLVEAGRLVEARDLERGVSLLPVSPRESDKGREARQTAVSEAAALDARIPKIALSGRPPGLTVTLDSKPLTLADAAWQGVDPGPHALAGRLGDRVCWSMTATLVESEARTIDMHDAASACRTEPLAPPPPPPPTPTSTPTTTPTTTPTPTTTTTTTPTPTTTAEPDHESWSAWKWTGAAVATGGAIAVGIGAYVALAAKSDYDSVASECPARGCTQDGYDVRQSARGRADAAGVVIGLGAGAFAGGALLFFLSGSSHGADASAARVGVGPGRVALTLRFD